MPVRVAINGFGRTGRATFRAAHERGADIEWVGINDVMDIEMLAHLLRHDSVYGPFPGTVEVRDGAIVVDGVEIPVTAETDPASLPWGDVGADVVIESSGRFRDRAGAAKHLEAGARKVIISAPAKEPDVTVALGINFDHDYDPRAPRHHLQRVVHDELPGPRGQGAQRGVRHPPRRDDHRARLHRRPDAARRAAQGLPARPQRRASTSCRRRPAPPRRSASSSPSSRPPAGLRRAGPAADGVARRPHRRGRARDVGAGGQRRDARARRPGRARAASSPTARSRSSRPTSSSRPTRRSSTPGSRS